MPIINDASQFSELADALDMRLEATKEICRNKADRV